MENIEVINKINILTDTIEEALIYIKNMIQKLNYEMTLNIINDLLEAFESIKKAISKIDYEEQIKILELIDILNQMVMSYDKSDYETFNSKSIELQNQYFNWKIIFDKKFTKDISS